MGHSILAAAIRWALLIAAIAGSACNGRASDGKTAPPGAEPPPPTTGRDAGPPTERVAAPAPPDAGPAGRLLVSWGGTNLFGSDLFTIDARLDARVEYRDASGQLTSHGPLRLDAKKLRALQGVLDRNKVCSLVSAPGYLPVPEETRTTLTVDIGGMRCAVWLYANEWQSRPAAAAIEAAIRDLSLRVQRARR